MLNSYLEERIPLRKDYFIFIRDWVTSMFKAARSDAVELTSLPISFISVWLRCCQATSARLPHLPAYSLLPINSFVFQKNTRKSKFQSALLKAACLRSPLACAYHRQALGRTHSPGTWECRFLPYPPAFRLYPAPPVLYLYRENPTTCFLASVSPLETLKSGQEVVQFGGLHCAPNSFWKTVFLKSCCAVNGFVMAETFSFAQTLSEHLKLIPCRFFTGSRIWHPGLNCSAKTCAVLNVIFSTRGGLVIAPRFVISALPYKLSCFKPCGMKPYERANSRKYLLLNISRLILFHSQSVLSKLSTEGDGQGQFF